MRRQVAGPCYEREIFLAHKDTFKDVAKEQANASIRPHSNSQSGKGVILIKLITCFPDLFLSVC